ncbi:carboxypeptidase-like regulatory domain-containing protein [Niabella hibiscisoli]|uniref:carboxypeptidase-like regulatory domain-containing protein n=1 Tax=Niabella hibiscisoli TaxID=1825928 RepID=UPI0021D44474
MRMFSFKEKCPFFYLSILFLITGGHLFAQNQQVSGLVTDSSGTPIAGVSVTIEGSNLSTQTNASGKYTINTSPNTILIFSFIGYDTEERKITGSVLNIALRRAAAGSLDDVVVIGYGAVKRKDLTTAVGSVNMPDLQKAPVRSFDEALAGRVAGVQVSSQDGQPGAGINILVRGPDLLILTRRPCM